MALQRFRPLSRRCKLCQGEVELSLSGNEPDPTDCPKCGQAIERCPSLSAPQMKILRKPSASEAKSAGFKVLKRVEKGEYESQ